MLNLASSRGYCLGLPRAQVLLTKGKSYRLRQHFFRGDRKAEFDVAYTFTYEGALTQNEADSADSQAFVLRDREVCTDTTNIVWASTKQ